MLKSLFGIVKTGDGFVKWITGECGRELLEFTKGSGCFGGLYFGFNCVVSAGTLDERVGSPAVSSGIDSMWGSLI